MMCSLCSFKDLSGILYGMLNIAGIWFYVGTDKRFQVHTTFFTDFI